jgi:DNA-binding LacI/PurR family transcriptional regulator
VPVILIGVPEETAGLPCIDVDFALAARMAVDELAALGHRRLAVIGHSPEAVARDINFVRRFQRGVDEAALAHGLVLDVVSPVEATLDGVRAGVDRALAAGTDGLGIVVPNSAAIHLVLRVLAERGVAPGRDVSVVGICTDVAAEAMQPPVTNVSLEPRDVSARAMTTLFQLLEDDGDPPPSGVQLLTPRLTRRATTVAR